MILFGRQQAKPYAAFRFSSIAMRSFCDLLTVPVKSCAGKNPWGAFFGADRSMRNFAQSPLDRNRYEKPP